MAVTIGWLICIHIGDDGGDSDDGGDGDDSGFGDDDGIGDDGC